MKKSILILFLTVMPLSSGCMTLESQSSYHKNPAKTLRYYNGNMMYAGTRLDLEWLTSIFWYFIIPLADLPFSLAADTLILPLTIYQTATASDYLNESEDEGEWSNALTVAEKLQNLRNGMENYMLLGNADYSQEHINKCEKILYEFVLSVQQAGREGTSRDAFIMVNVKSAVLKLNVLNKECNGGLIETDQREQICDLITYAALNAGLVTDLEDITWEWREW